MTYDLRLKPYMHPQEAIRLRANYADAYTAMGVSLKELGRKQEAQACFQVVARLRPACALSLGNLAGVYYEQVREFPPLCVESRGCVLGMHGNRSHFRA